MTTISTRLQRLQAIKESIIELIADGIDLPDTLAQIDNEIKIEQSKKTT